jgi:hypothetical protein
MARRKSKAKARSRSRKPAFNITNAAQSFIIANAVTKGVAGTNLIPFLTEGWLRDKTAGDMGGSGNSWTFSAQELIQGAISGDFGMSSAWDKQGIKAAFEKNMKENGAMALTTVIATPILFKLGKNLLSKPIIAPANRLLKSVGLKGVKV